MQKSVSLAPPLFLSHHGVQVIARPKLATPSIYQHSRGRANEDRSPDGLGRTTRSTTTSESIRPSSTRGSTRATTPWSRGDGWQDGGYTGDVHAWDEEDHCDEEAVQARVSEFTAAE